MDFPSIWLPEAAAGNAASLGRQQRDGRGTQQERGVRHRHHPAHDRSPAIGRLEKWLLTEEPPKYRYAIDPAKAARGAKIYQQYCASCHGASGREFGPPKGDTSRECLKPNEPDDDLYAPHVGRITRIEEIGTDRRRLDSYSWDLVVHMGTVYAGYPHRYCHYRKTHGYANMPLDGIWLRAPYLHNGSVPNLRELLEPVANRSKVFWRGNDVYDTSNVGFVANLAEQDGRKFFKFDTEKPGNSNAGHVGKHYGTELSPSDKDALVEHLKTF